MTYLRLIDRCGTGARLSDRFVLMLALLMGLALSAPMALAQTADETQAESSAAQATDNPDQALADRQAVVSDRVKRLEDRMLRMTFKDRITGREVVVRYNDFKKSEGFRWAHARTMTIPDADIAMQYQFDKVQASDD